MDVTDVRQQCKSSIWRFCYPVSPYTEQWFYHIPHALLVHPLGRTATRLVEKDLAQAIRVLVSYQTKPVRPPYVDNRPYTSQFPAQSSNTTASGYYGYTFSLEPVEADLYLDFNPWLAETRCGGRAFRASIIEGNQPIVIKCWDSYKHDSSRRDNEVSIYMRIQSLWNVCVPRLIGIGEIDFCHSLFWPLST